MANIGFFTNPSQLVVGEEYRIVVPAAVLNSSSFFDENYGICSFLKNSIFICSHIGRWADMLDQKVKYRGPTGRAIHILVEFNNSFGSVFMILDPNNLLPVTSDKEEIICVCDTINTLSRVGCLCGAVQRERERRFKKKK